MNVFFFLNYELDRFYLLIKYLYCKIFIIDNFCIKIYIIYFYLVKIMIYILILIMCFYYIVFVYLDDVNNYLYLDI